MLAHLFPAPPAEIVCSRPVRAQKNEDWAAPHSNAFLD